MLATLVGRFFEDMVKYVADVERGVVAVGGELHWVADASGLLRYDCDGQELPRLPSSGDEAGEYRYAAFVGTLTDSTIALFDPRLRRINRFSEQGVFLGATELPDSVIPPGDVRGLGRFGGHMVWWTVEKPRGPATATEHRSFAWILDEGTGRVDSVLAVAAPEWVIRRDRINTVAVEAPFGARPIMVFNDGRLLVGNTNSDVVSVYHDPNGAPNLVALELEQRAVRLVDIESYSWHIRRQLFGELERRDFGPEMREYFSSKFTDLLANLEFPDSTGYFSMLAWSGEGEIWALTPCAAGQEPCTWPILDMETGKRLRSVQVSHRGRVLGAAVLGESLFTIEALDGRASRIAKYMPNSRQ